MSATLLTTCPQDLADRIERAVHTRTGGRIRGLHVQVVEEGVIVSGRTSTYYNKQLVTHAVMEADVTGRVFNEVEVCHTYC